MSFTKFVTRGMFDLDKAIQEGSPAGLRSLGTWKTFYEGLASLPERAKESWLAFDHFYSDLAFPAALPLVFAERPTRLLDLGGNTGKWALQCIKYDPHVHVTIADLPRQLELARQSIHLNGFESRLTFFPIDVLNGSMPLPQNQDAIWMSQFLDCFSERQIVSILQRAALAMQPHTICISSNCSGTASPTKPPRFVCNKPPSTSPASLTATARCTTHLI